MKVKSPAYRTGFAGVKRRVASRMSYLPSYVHPVGMASQSIPSYVHPLQGRPGATSPISPNTSVAPPSPTAPVVDPAKPSHDATYNAGVADIISTRNRLTSQLASAYTNNTADATTGANKAGLLHSSTLANKLKDLQTGYRNDLEGLTTQYGKGEDYGTEGIRLLGDEQARHADDPQPTVVDNATLQSLNQGRFQPGQTVQLASGWRILYDASGKPVKFLKPGEEA